MSNVPVVQKIYAAFGRGDIAGILEHHSVDFEWRVPGRTPYSGTFRGRDGVGRFFAALVGAVDVLGFAPERFIDGGDTVVVVGSEKLKAKSTGRVYENRWVQIWTLKSGRVVAFEEHFDTAAAEAAFGK